MRRIAVHFCPAFVVISRCTSVINSSNSTLSGLTSGPRIEPFRLSCSAVKRTPFFKILGVLRSANAVEALPVKLTKSWQSNISRRSPVLPIINWMAPRGKSPLSSIKRTTACAKYPLLVAGFIKLGTPASKLAASFSSIPQTGKLNALICTATPCKGV